jgi:hypothetical protein
MKKKKTVSFATNWNCKLENDFFISIRRNKLDIAEGEDAIAWVADMKAEFDIRIIREYKTRLDKLTDLTTYLDSGLNKVEFIDYFQRAYKEDLNRGFLYIYLIRRLGRELIPF